MYRFLVEKEKPTKEDENIFMMNWINWEINTIESNRIFVRFYFKTFGPHEKKYLTLNDSRWMERFENETYGMDGAPTSCWSKIFTIVKQTNTIRSNRQFVCVCGETYKNTQIKFLNFAQFNWIAYGHRQTSQSSDHFSFFYVTHKQHTVVDAERPE